MKTEICTWGLCFTPLNSVGYVKIFGFAEFLAALALLVVLFTITDVRYKFRTEIVPGGMYRSTFVVMIVLGLLTLMSEVWVAQEWYVPKALWFSHVTWQALMGVVFFGTFATWMYYAFIGPPVFHRRNAERYAHTLFRYLVKADDGDLKVLAHEIGRSAKNLVRWPQPRTAEVQANLLTGKPPPSGKHIPIPYANDILLLIANRKLCRYIVQSSPVTVAAFLAEATHDDGAWSPIGRFATTISIEAFANKESFVFQEDAEYDTGLIGHLKPITLALYGRYKLMERLAQKGPFPFDIPYDDTSDWDGAQWEAYCRLALLLFADYLKVTEGREKSQALLTVFRRISLEHMPATYAGDGVYKSSTYRRLNATVRFIKDAVALIDKNGGPPDSPRPSEPYKRESIYDHLAHLMFDACVHVARIERKDFTSWDIQHNSVWSKFFDHQDSITWKIVRKRLVHLLSAEVCEIQKRPHFVNVPLLGYCANVMGLTLVSKSATHSHDWRSLQRLVLWLIRKHYARLLIGNVRLAEAMLVGKLSFDPIRFSVVKTYEMNLNDVAPIESLEVEGAFRKTFVRRLQKRHR